MANPIANLIFYPVKPNKLLEWLKRFLFKLINVRHLLIAVHGYIQVFDKPIPDIINPAMDGRGSSLLPGILNNGSFAQVINLLNDIKFNKSILSRFYIVDRL